MTQCAEPDQHLFDPAFEVAAQVVGGALVPNNDQRPGEEAMPVEISLGQMKRSIKPEDDCLIDAWIAARCAEVDPGASTARPNHTERAYRKEARRFALWLQRERGVGLATATLADCVQYRMFLRDPAPREIWCGPRGRSRHDGWKPFEGPLSPRSVRQAIIVLKALFKFLVESGARIHNPWMSVAAPRSADTELDPRRSLSHEQWSVLQASLVRQSASLRGAQLLFATRILYLTGARLSEIVTARCGDLRRVTNRTSLELGDPSMPVSRETWVLGLVGKGLRRREVPVAGQLIEQLQTLMTQAGHAADFFQEAGRPLLCGWSANAEASIPASRSALSSQSLYRQLKAGFRDAAEQLMGEGREDDARLLTRASTHWLRHTHASHSLDAGVPLDVVRESLGHKSLATTSIYARADLARRTRESVRLVANVQG